MPEINVMVYKWLAQLGDWDQSSAFSAWQSLEQEVLRSSRPGNATGAEEVAKAIAEALVAPKPDGIRNDRLGQSSYTPGARRIMARMLGYIPTDTVLPQMAQALKDLDVREMVRCSLEANPSEGATDLLIGALDHSGATFRVGVVNSLGMRKGAKVHAALKKSAADPQTEVRIAALEALAGFPDPSLDAILSKATSSEHPEEKRRAHVARARLAAVLRNANDRSAADRVCNSILASDAPDPQKNSAKRTLAG
jgi:HEAT repeat protein